MLLDRYLSADVDFLDRLSTAGTQVDLFLATLGGELYSNLLGAGNRRYLNPYLGLRAGYARNLGLDELALGATVGVELIKTDSLTLDLQSRFFALLGTPERRVHALVQPSLAFHIAY